MSDPQTLIIPFPVPVPLPLPLPLPPSPDQVLENVIESIFAFLLTRRDRNAASLVCKSWYIAESYTRSDLFIANCYSISPHRIPQRFTRLKSITLKGRPRFADFGLMAPDWGAKFGPWIDSFVVAYGSGLERICLKRMTVRDEDLERVAIGFAKLREITLVCCDGFGTNGLAAIAANCRELRVLDLIEDELNVDDEGDDVDWIGCFPENMTCLESLSFECVEEEVNFHALERLVARSPNLRRLRVNQSVSLEQVHRLMVRAPQLTHLGTGSFSPSADLAGLEENEPDYRSAFAACRSLVCMSGFRSVLSGYLPAIYPVCGNLTSLNLSYANLNAQELKSIVSQCHKLRTLLVLDTVRDEGLEAVGATCKDLVELRVFPLDAREDSEGFVSEVGLLAIAEGCRKLRSILYFCQRMTNAAVISMSKNCPDLVVFRLCIMGRLRPDYVTNEPMDEGFGAIVMNCKKLTRLAVSGLLTDNAFAYIGKYGKLVRTLSVAFAGDSDMALKYVLQGCSNLQKLEIRDSPFGDSALLAGLDHYYKMRFFWMSSCKVTLRACRHIAITRPRMVVEVFTNGTVPVQDEDEFVDTLYMYRSLAGPRTDNPSYVRIL